MHEDPQAPRGLALTAILLCTVAWGVSPIFIRILSTAYQPSTQTFVRYSFACLFLVPFSLLFYRADLLRGLRHPGPLLGIGLLNTATQYGWTYGCYGTDATVASLFTKLMVVFVIVFSFLLFREERNVIKSPLYLLGTFASLAGVALVLMKDAASFVPAMDRYTVVLFFVSIGWAVYAVWGKHIATTLHAVPMFTVIAIVSTVGYGSIALAREDLGDIPRAGLATSAVAALSGIFPIAMAHSFFHYAQRHLGSAFCTSVTLLNPLVTFSLALVFLPEEHMRPAQLFGGAILIGGTFAVAWSEQRAYHKGLPLDIGP